MLVGSLGHLKLHLQHLFVCCAVPLRGALIDVAGSRVQSFNITKAKGYQFPQGFASCMSTVGSTPVYLETGGWYYDDQGTPRTQPGFVAVPMQLGKTVQPMLTVAGAADPAGGRVFSALACSPDGAVYTFGGLRVAKYDQIPLDYDQDGKTDRTVPEPVWAATNSLHLATLGGSDTAPAFSKAQLLGPSAAANGTARNRNVPGPRAGHTLTYLSPSTVASLGLNSGALFLYGGSNLTIPTLTATLTNESDTAEALSDVTFDPTAWLFDLGSGQWVKLQPDGLSDAAPGLMYHSAAVQGTQVSTWMITIVDIQAARETGVRCDAVGGDCLPLCCIVHVAVPMAGKPIQVHYCASPAHVQVMTYRW